MLVNVKKQIETQEYRLSSWLFRGTVNSPMMVGTVNPICIGFLTLREEGEIVDLSDTVYFKKHVSKGDYQQTKGSHSEKVIPTGKLFGLRKFDYVKTWKGSGFVKGKRRTGFFAISDLEGKVINPSVNVKKHCIRLNARTTTLIERRLAHSSAGQARAVSCA